MLLNTTDCTLAELLKVYNDKADVAYQRYCASVHSKDDDTIDRCYRRWAYFDDCLQEVRKLVTMVSTEPA